MAEILGMDLPQNYQPQLVQDFSQQQEISQLTKAALSKLLQILLALLITSEGR